MVLGQRLGSVRERYQTALAHPATRTGMGTRAERRGWLMSGGDLAAQANSGAAAHRRSRLEAVLLVSKEPLSLRKLAQLANLTDGTEARTLIAQLRVRYDQRGCAFQVEQVGGGYQLLTRPKFAPWLRPICPSGEGIRLSAPALETLAVVAYRQPVLRAEVEAIRGVGCGELLRQLMERDLVRIVGRSDELGRPLAYGTTKRFLREFGLCSLDDLPLASELRRGRDEETAPESGLETPSHGGLTGGVEAA